MTHLHKQVSFRISDRLYQRIHDVSERKNLRLGKFLNQLLEKSLDLLEVGQAPSLPALLSGRSPSLTQDSLGKIYVLKHVEYETGEP